jgi:hypothetical protein
MHTSVAVVHEAHRASASDHCACTAHALLSVVTCGHAAVGRCIRAAVEGSAVSRRRPHNAPSAAQLSRQHNSLCIHHTIFQIAPPVAERRSTTQGNQDSFEAAHHAWRLPELSLQALPAEPTPRQASSASCGAAARLRLASLPLLCQSSQCLWRSSRPDVAAQGVSPFRIRKLCSDAQRCCDAEAHAKTTLLRNYLWRAPCVWRRTRIFPCV